MPDEDPVLAEVTEKELLLELFRQVRAIRRLIVFVVFGLPILSIVAIGLLGVVASRS